MLHTFRALLIATTFGFFASSYAVDTPKPQETKKHKPSIGLNDILSTRNNLSNTAGRMFMNSAGGGTIHFLKAYFYDNFLGADCSGTLLGAASVIDNSAGFTFSNSQLVSLNTSAAYKLVTSQSIIPGDVKCLKLYVDGSNATPNSVGCQTYYDETCNSGTSKCDSDQIKSVFWQANLQGSPCATRYAYVPQNGGGSVKLYSVNSSTGALSDEGDAGLFSSPYGIALNNGFAYVTNSSGGANNSVKQCPIIATSGAFGTCTDTPLNLVIPEGIAINSGYIYVTDADNSGGSVTRCSIDAQDGTLSSCDLVAGGSVPAGIAINNNYLYIANSGNSTITKCIIGPMAPFTCGTTGSSLNGPSGLAINNGYAYITNIGDNTITKCTIDPISGVFSPCGPTATSYTFSNPGGIAIINSFAYISAVNDGTPTAGTVTQCTVSLADGELTCSAVNEVGSLNSPRLLSIF